MTANASGARAVAPGADEQRIARLCEEILGVESVDVDADFFALGGQSLKAMQLLAAINDTFATELQFGDLVDQATPRALARRIDSLRLAGEAEQPLLERREREDAPFMARGQLLFWRLGNRPELATYFNLRQALLLRGALEVTALHGALQALTDRHESLRMHFRPLPGAVPEDVELIIPARQAVTFELLEAPAQAAAEPQEFVREQLQQELSRPFDLRGEPLIRFRLVRFSPTLHALLVTMHHLITDAWSFNVLRRELNELYSARLRGRSAQLPELPIRYSDFAHWNYRLHQSEPFRRQHNYWQELFASLASEEPGRRAGAARGEASGTGYADLSIDERDVVRLAQRAAAHSTTSYVLLQVLMHLTLYATFPQVNRMLVLSPAAERQRAELQDSIGLHITIVGVRSEIAADTTLRQLIAQLKRAVHEALEHQESRQFALYDVAAHQPRDFPLFVYNNFVLPNDCAWALDDLRVEPVFPRAEDPRAFVTLVELYHARGPSGLWGQLKHDLAGFGDEAARGFVGDYRRIMQTLLSGSADDLPIAGLIGR